MALELVGGALLSAFLQVAFDKLSSPQVLDFFRGRKLDHKLLSRLETKLHSIYSLADDAERKQFTDPHVRNWLLNVKDVVLDAEDLLDEIQDKVSKSQVEAESESQTLTGCTCKVPNFFKSSSLSSFNKEIKSRMEQVLDSLEFLSNQKGDLGLKAASGLGSGFSNELPRKSQTTSLVVGSDIYGRDDDKEKIFHWLTSDRENPMQPSSILSIVGMGGLGKTTLAQHVFNDPRMEEAKFDVKAWICVSDEFDVFRVSKAILEAVTGSTDDSRDLEMVHRRLKEKLMEKKFLLVLDDVWNEYQFKWEDVQKPLVFGAQGSKVLVTTRSKTVAYTMRSEEYPLEQLQEDDCWKLFAKHAQPNPECKEIGMKMVKKCKGLPLALKTMGSLLYNKSSVSEWETVFQSEIWELSEDIIPALALSYIHLPSHLKACFAYCALFPKDYEFYKESLIQLWMTENFPQFRQHSQSPEEACQQYFNDLLSRSFFQQAGENEEVFVMHDLLNDLAKYVGGDIYFRWEVDHAKEIQKITRHLSLELITYNQKFDGFGTLCDTKRLRTFVPKTRSEKYIYHSWHCNMSIHELFSKFKLLRILSLSRCSELKEVPDSVGNLEHLRSFDLSYTAIKKLTEKICSLSHLQTLKLSHCNHLEELPSNLHLLTNLCRLEFIQTKVRKVPEHLGKLKNLKVMMSSFKVGRSRALGIQQLGALNLHGCLSIGDLQNIENSLDASEADLKNKTHLVELLLQWDWSWNRNPIDSTKEGEIIEKLKPSKQLRKLSIINYCGKQFPNWLVDNSLLNMVFLVLERCESCQLLPPLGLLPFLKDVKINYLDGIVSIDADFYGNNSCSFKSLETLEFTSMKEWEKWECKDVIGAFPHLQRLSIKNCPKLKGHLPKQLVPLIKLEIYNCQQLEASAPRASQLNLEDCGIVQFDWATLKTLSIGGHNMEAWLVEMLGQIVSDTSLEHLLIYSTSDDDFVSLRAFLLDLFPKLKTLSLSGFRNLQLISQGHTHNQLQYLSIRKCPEFESLPGNMHMLLPSLKKLCIEDCPRLESFPEGGWPSNLKEMELENCSRLVESLKGALRDDPSLETLWIGEVDAECFPEEGLLPLSLTSLYITHSPNLKKLDYNGLCQLSSLKKLLLKDCVHLHQLPEEGLPTSISDLAIIGQSQLLTQRCQRSGGKDWPKIAHIQSFYIDTDFAWDFPMGLSWEKEMFKYGPMNQICKRI
ncbi:unnamed protein product [Sphenostylis stenocarpa]|uniref:Disease resistance RPP13-like protein 1 n=1 Tax=Sphenostylis stenocarpa TaxID=92480 RepID=A0AA86W417_9FABA|nr:unnamed protein product [Sphenostylis stenocarpa]